MRLVEGMPRRMIVGPSKTIAALTKIFLVAQQMKEADSVNILSLREQISLLDARKAEDELLASKVPDLEVMIIDGDGSCLWSALSVFSDSAGLPPESPESIMKGTADVLRAVNTNDDQCKSPCYFSLSWCVRADLIWLGCLGTDEICQDHAKNIDDYISHGEHVLLAAAFYANITIRVVEKVGEPMEFCPKAAATRFGFEPKGVFMCAMVRFLATGGSDAFVQSDIARIRRRFAYLILSMGTRVGF
jgi:hypothetical protein